MSLYPTENFSSCAQPLATKWPIRDGGEAVLTSDTTMKDWLMVTQINQSPRPMESHE